MYTVVQLRAVQFQRRRNLVVLRVAVTAHPGRGGALDQIHSLRVLVFVDLAILQREIVVGQPGGAVVGLRIELEELVGDRIQAVRGNDVAGKRRACPRGANDRASRGVNDHPTSLSRL